MSRDYIITTLADALDAAQEIEEFLLDDSALPEVRAMKVARVHASRLVENLIACVGERGK